jgi:predicted phosphodiesterase
MIIGIFGDTHYSNRGPSRRKDNYFDTQVNKSLQAFSIFAKNNCDVIIQPGDLFDAHTTANEVKAKIINIFKDTNFTDFPVFCVSGQHDISGHSLYTLKNSPLAVLQAAGVVKILTAEKEGLGYGGGVGVYGASFGEEIPEPKCKDEFNILVIHKMIGDRELYPGQELVKPNQFLKSYPDYSLVICGDYHYSFSSQYQGRTIINAGCLVRKTIGKYDLEHKPSVVIFDTETGIIKWEQLKFEPAETVFDLTRSKEVDKSGIEELIASLKGKLGPCEQKTELLWKTTLEQVIREKKTSVSVKNIIDAGLEEVQK